MTGGVRVVSARWTVGMDIGGTKTHAVALDRGGQVSASSIRPTGFGASEVTAAARHALVALARELDVPVHELGSVGIGVPGAVDIANGIVTHAVNLGITALDLRGALQGETGGEVVVDNDVNAAALGAARSMDVDGSIAYLNVGTGLAAGFVDRRGDLERGATGVRGEIGHLPVVPDGRLCSCGQRGCLETVASGSAVAAAWPSPGGSAVASMLEAADHGQPEALVVRDRLVDGVVTAAQMLLLSADPDLVVLGGGVLNSGDGLRVLIQERMRAREASSAFVTSIELSARVRFMPAGSDHAAIGAGLLVLAR
ncbi:ROK family protein [Microbacterium tumbae]